MNSAEERRAGEILRRLQTLRPRRREYASLIVADETHDAFQVLVVTILTQSCTDVAALRAFRRLRAEIGSSPAALAAASPERIERAIREAGLQHQKARALFELARIVLRRYGGTLNQLMQRSWEEARSLLVELPKVGPKTADVLLAVWGRPTISVDTHVNRVARRLGLVPKRGGYDRVRSALMALYPPRMRPQVSVYLMALGRRICKARRPLCPICPVEPLCPYPNKTKRLKATVRARGTRSAELAGID